MNDQLYRDLSDTIDDHVTERFGIIPVIVRPINRRNLFYRFDHYSIGIFTYDILYEIMFQQDGDYKHTYKAYTEEELFDTIDWLFDTKIGPPGDVY